MTNNTHSAGRHLRGAVAALAAIATSSIAGLAHADTGSASFEDANRASAQGHYPEATVALEALAHARGWSAPLLYNLANAHAQQGAVGLAVLGYERARLLEPSDPDIAANLLLVRANAGLAAPVRPWYQTSARLLSTTAWTALAASLLWLAAVAFAVARRRRSRLLGYASVFAALVGMISVAGAAVLDRNLDDAVIVAKKSASVRLSPFDSAAVEATVPEGDEVAVIGRHGDFVRVRDGQGRTGWVDSAAVQLIVPRDS